MLEDDHPLDHDRIVFRPEDDVPLPGRKPWRILAIDDDVDFQASLKHALKGASILDRPVELHLANGRQSAAHLLARDRDFAVILVDVVMETDDAGLRLIKGIRDMLGMAEPRVILLTGQPGFAPIDDVMRDYDLSDYCLKSDLAKRGLKNILTGAIRAYHQLATINGARKGLQLILEASNRFSVARSVQDMASAALAELATLLGIPEEGIVAVEGASVTSALDVTGPAIIGAAGRFAPHVGQSITALPDESIAQLLADTLAQRSSISTALHQVLYIPRQHALADYAIYVETGRPLDEPEAQLLAVFAANAAKGFSNVALISRLDRMAYEDDLLGIPNRNGLLREIERTRLSPEGSSAQLMLIDLDNFAGINEAFGVAVGNAVLRAIYAPLRILFPPPCIVGRISADLFAVLGPASRVELSRVERIFHEELHIGGQSFRFTVCASQIGVGELPGEAADLMRAARSTLRRAKRQGQGSLLKHDPQIELEAGARFELMSRLAHAIEHDLLELHFQPMVALDTGRIIGAEALIRWPAGHGGVGPDVFIPLAEKSSYIHAIGDRVLEQSCAALREFDAAGLGALTVSVNASARQFESPTFIGHIVHTLKALGIEARRLKVEVTETAVVENMARLTSQLAALRATGVRIAIDDFGTGQASLAYVHLLPADLIKLDMSFVQRIGRQDRSEAITKIMIDMGRAIGADLVAEGVETEAQARWLREHGCQTGQGWHFGRPMPLPEFIAFCLEQPS